MFASQLKRTRKSALWLDAKMYEAAPAAKMLLTGVSAQRTMRIPSSNTSPAEARPWKRSQFHYMLQDMPVTARQYDMQ
jgi:hypothetical protein